MITIGRESSFYRPYVTVVNGTARFVRKIHIYNEKGIILTIGSGWLEKSGFEDIKELQLKTDEIKLRRKENFSNKEVFIISVKPEYSNENQCELYIHNDFIGFKKTGREMDFNFSIIDTWKAEKVGAYHKQYRHDIKVSDGIRKLERDFTEIKEKYDFNVTKDTVDEDIQRLTEIRKAWKEEKERLEKLDINKL